ncbi:type III secretion system domain-containing protein [Cedecea sp. S5-13]|uniref:type III secretion system domain-containing protein n=1 Tax=Cedecea selenatireducens TaxID=3144416 RepID=UPI0035CD1000
MDKSTSLGFDASVAAGNAAADFSDVDSLAQKRLAPRIPDEALLRMHRYLWTPARYAHSRWLTRLGFAPAAKWRYGANPPLDRCLNQALQVRRGTPRLPVTLSLRQQRMVQLAPRLQAFALATGLLVLGCNDYFLLPDYRRALLHLLDDVLIWQLFGLCQGNHRALFSPTQTVEIALQLGTAVLTRAAQNDPVLYALLITLAPCERALWLPVPALAMNLLERTLCADFR